MVLILVLMEDTLRGQRLLLLFYCKGGVLILVLMEDTLRGTVVTEGNNLTCLNPCFNGRYSQSNLFVYRLCDEFVLILVLMEDTLRDYRYVSWRSE